MKLRLPLLALAVTGTMATAASCSSVNHPAATVNGHKISMDTFLKVAKGLQMAQDGQQATDPATPARTPTLATGDNARTVLQALITSEVFAEELAKSGHPLTDADLKTVSDSLVSNPTYAAYAPDVQRLVVELTAAQNAFAAAHGTSQTEAQQAAQAAFAAASIQVDPTIGVWSTQTLSLVPLGQVPEGDGAAPAVNG